ncbi:MAG: hypothetical protein AAF637_13055 [Pseudomonadota bacterium]
MAVDPPVEPVVLQASIERLRSLLPDFAALADSCLWDIYVGWKTDAPGPDPKPLLGLGYPRPYHITDAGLINAHVVWPNHWCLASAAAANIAQTLERACKPRRQQPELPAHRISAVPMKWCRSDRQWRSWPDFVASYGLHGEPAAGGT